MEFGKARKMKNFVVITLGSCLGSGIISDQNLNLGLLGAAAYAWQKINESKKASQITSKKKLKIG